MSYALNELGNVQGMENARVLKDALFHMVRILDAAELKKTERRSGAKQLAYKLAKGFGHRSSYHDLYLHHVSMQPVLGQEPMIPIPEITRLEVHYRLVILGRGTKRALQSGNVLQASTQTPNEIFLDFTHGYRRLTMLMELTANAFVNLCGDLGKTRSLAVPMMEKIRAKWGSTGENFGVYEPWGNRQGDEGYRLVRTVHGQPMVQTVGANWISGYDNRKQGDWA